MARIDYLNTSPVDMGDENAQPANQTWSITPVNFAFASEDGTYPPVQGSFSAASDSSRSARNSRQESLAWRHQVMRSATASPERAYEPGMDEHDTVFHYQHEIWEQKQKAQRRRQQNRAAQQAFRKRKEEHLKDLKSKILDLEAVQSKIASENHKLKEDLQKATNENSFLRTLITPSSLTSYHQQKYATASGQCDRDIENLSPGTYWPLPPNSMGFNTPYSGESVPLDSGATSAASSDADRDSLFNRNQALEFIIKQYLMGH